MKGRFIFHLIVISGFFLSCCSQHTVSVKDGQVHLYLKKPEVNAVYFANSSDGFKRHQAAKIDRTTWQVTVPGNTEFSYFYIIDGAIFLPDCQFKETDDFGSQNCIFIPDM